MYYALSLLVGVIVSVMIVFNGELTAQYGAYSATVIIHIVGLALIGAIALVREEKPFQRRYPWFCYLGGVIGVGTTVANNVAFGRISVSAILAIGLLGQTLAGMLVDQFGLFGMRVRRLRAYQLAGVAIALCGIAFMMIGSFSLLPVALTFLSGVFYVVSRSLNAAMSERAGVTVGTLYNFITGLVTAIPVLLLVGRGELGGTFTLSPKWWIYLGGACGVACVQLSTLIVRRVSALYISLLCFIGQIFAGVALDALLSGAFSMPNFVGGLLVTAGLCLNLLLERREAKRAGVEAA